VVWECAPISVTESPHAWRRLCLRPPVAAVFKTHGSLVGWLGRGLWTLLAMGLAGFVVLVLGLSWVAPSVVDEWPDQVVRPFEIVLSVAAAVSVATAVLFWRHYPTLLRSRGIGWGTD
jgi:hypothetical protein